MLLQKKLLFPQINLISVNSLSSFFFFSLKETFEIARTVELVAENDPASFLCHQ